MKKKKLLAEQFKKKELLTMIFEDIEKKRIAPPASILSIKLKLFYKNIITFRSTISKSLIN